jgi:quercetin dioxygenase-like cupin family protein
MKHSTEESGRKDLASKVINLAGLVAYQEDAVVSNTIIDKKTGTVTIFAFDEAQGLSEHTAPFDARVCVLNGEAIITISGKTHRLKEGDAILMPANEPHALEGPGKFKIMLTMIRS